jgi:hypothetical protein
VNATLSDALVALTFDLAKLSENYEKTAPVLSKKLTDRLVQGAKYLDEMDADGLADIQLSNIVSNDFNHNAGRGRMTSPCFS